jgi:predicted glycoside hydrolase/deacetylase ChbG (UPF0249 family)
MMLIFNILKKQHYFFPKITSVLACCLLLVNTTRATAQKTLAEKLGYAKDAKLLIIHADDLGLSHTENTASIKAIDSGAVTSGSIMMPTPWVTEIASYAKKHNNTHDLGLHLVLTSEWKNYRWRPVAPKEKVASLVDADGYFYKDCQATAKAEEVAAELRAQIEMAYAMGITPTHLDSHMGCLFWTSQEIFKVYVQLAHEYQLPCLVDKSFAALFDSTEAFNTFLNSQEVAVVVDTNLTISPEDYQKGTAAYYTKVLQSLQPGLTQILIHTAYDSDEMQAITTEHPDWGAAWRQADFDFFTSEACLALLQKENIKLVTWRAIAKALKK